MGLINYWSGSSGAAGGSASPNLGGALAAAGVPERSRALPGAGRQGSLQLRRAPLETDEVRVAQADGDKNRQLRQRICQQVKNKSVLSRISFHLLQDIPPVLAQVSTAGTYLSSTRIFYPKQLQECKLILATVTWSLCRRRRCTGS